MDEGKTTESTVRALEVATRAWEQAHQGLAANPMTRTAAIPATAVLAVALLQHLDQDDATLTARTKQAIVIARRAWQRTHRESPGNPIAATAERSVIGILAAGILSLPDP